MIAMNSLLPYDRITRLLNEVEAAAIRRREADLACARALAELADLDGFHHAGCASVGELGERYGLAAAEARDLLDLGRALRVVPGIEDLVRQGRVTVPSAGCLGRVFSSPGLLREGDDWIVWAQRESTHWLRRRLQQRLEEARAGTAPVFPLVLYVRLAGLEDFQRARLVASRKRGKAVTNGETLEILADYYLDAFDIRRKQAGGRRIPDTTLVAGRYVPMEVRREVYARQGERCAIPFCDHVLFLDFAHLVPHASGGSREADNLLLLCGEHHFWFDSGAIRLAGTAVNPRFLDREGRDLSSRFVAYDETAPEPTEYERLLEWLRHEDGPPALPGSEGEQARPGPAPP